MYVSKYNYYNYYNNDNNEIFFFLHGCHNVQDCQQYIGLLLLLEGLSENETTRKVATHEKYLLVQISHTLGHDMIL